MLKSKGYIPIKKFNQTQLQDHKPKLNNHTTTHYRTHKHTTPNHKKLKRAILQSPVPPKDILLRCGNVLSDVRIGLFDVCSSSHRYRSLSISYRNSLANMTLSLSLSLYLLMFLYFFLFYT